MATTFARMRQIIGTTAEWAANNIVLTLGELGIERGAKVMLKVGDGVNAYSNLPYLAGDADITSIIVNAGSGLTGGGTTGDITIGVDWTLVAPLKSPALTDFPTTPNQAPATLSNNYIANTAFVQSALAAGLANYAPINSPLFTGDPRTTTDPPIDDADRSIPSTKWVTDYFLKLKGGALTGAVTSTSTWVGQGLVQGANLHTVAASNASIYWNTTANAANTRKWYARHYINNVLRFARLSDADVELNTVDFVQEGSIFVPFTVPQARNDGTLASTNWISLKLNDFLSKSVGGVVTGDVTFTGSSAFAPIAGKTMTVPITPLNSVDNNIPATPAWVRDLLLTRTGTAARYKLSSYSDADIDPGAGHMTIEVLPDEVVEGVTFAARRIALSTHDDEGNERYLLMLMPGDAFVITDYVEEPPVTGFARYVIVEKPIPTPTPPPPPAPQTGVVWVKFDCYRIEQRGNLPTPEQKLVVTGFLNTATGDGPIIAINAGKNLLINTTGGATGASGVVTIDMEEKINIKGVLADWVGAVGLANLPLDPIDVGPYNSTVIGGRVRWRGAPSTGTTDMVQDIADDFFRWISYPKGTTTTATTLGTVNLIGGTLNWRGTITAGGLALPAPVPGVSSIQATSINNSAGVWAVGADGMQGAMGVYDKTANHYGAYLYSTASYAGLARINNVGNYAGELLRFGGTDGSVTLTGGPLYAGVGQFAEASANISTLTLINTGTNGVGLKFTGNGATTPNKWVRVFNGIWEVTNSAYSQTIFQILDSGAVNLTGALTGNTATFSGLTVSGSAIVNGNFVAGTGLFGGLQVGANPNGYIRLEQGGPVNAGFLGLHRADGARIGYIGYDNGAVLYQADMAGSYHLWRGPGNSTWASLNAGAADYTDFHTITSGGNKSVLRRVHGTSSYLFEVGAGISTRFSDFNTHYFRSDGGSTFVTITGTGDVGIGGLGGERLKVVNRDDTQTTMAGFYAHNETQGVGIYYGGIRKIGTVGDTPLNIDAAGAGSVNIAYGSTGMVLLGRSPAPGSNDTNVATTAWVNARIPAYIPAVPPYRQPMRSLFAYPQPQDISGGPNLILFNFAGGDSTYWQGGAHAFLAVVQTWLMTSVSMTVGGSANNDVMTLVLRRMPDGATLSQTQCQRYNNGPFTLTVTWSGPLDPGQWLDVIGYTAGTVSIYSGVYSTWAIYYQTQ